MRLINMNWGYDNGGIPQKEEDGYLNVELALLEQTGEETYLWMSRGWEYETVMIGDVPMYPIAMHMTHYDADFDLEMGYLESHAKEEYEYAPLEFPDEKLKRSRFYKEILFGREALNRYWDLNEQERRELIGQIKDCETDIHLLY